MKLYQILLFNKNSNRLMVVEDFTCHKLIELFDRLHELQFPYSKVSQIDVTGIIGTSLRIISTKSDSEMSYITII